MSRRRERGFKLIELLVVFAIIALLMGITFAISIHVRQQAQRTACMTNLRQLVSALQMYQQDWKAYYPLPTWNFWQSLQLYFRDEAITRCPSDPMPGGAASGRRSYYHAGRVAYNHPEYIFLDREASIELQTRAINELRERDPSHGVFACVVHGDRVSDMPLPRHGLAHNYYTGLVLRAQIDGAIRPVQVRFRCYETPEGVKAERLEWYLHTDATLPEWFNLREVECPAGARPD